MATLIHKRQERPIPLLPSRFVVVKGKPTDSFQLAQTESEDEILTTRLQAGDSGDTRIHPTNKLIKTW